MGTLINKGLVLRTSCPAKYRVTVAGCELARRLVHAGSVRPECEQVADSSRPADCRKVIAVERRSHAASSRSPVRAGPSGIVDVGSRPHSSSAVDVNLPSFTGIKSKTPASTASGLPHGGDSQRSSFVYVDAEDQEVLHKDAAAVTVDDEISVGFLAKFRQDGLVMSGFRYKVDTSRFCAGDYIFAYIHDDDAPEVAPCPALPGGSETNRTNIASIWTPAVCIDSQSSVPDARPTDVAVPAKIARTSKTSSAKTASAKASSSSKRLSERVESILLDCDTQDMERPSSGVSSRQTALNSACNPQLSLYSSSQALSSRGSTLAPTDIGHGDFVLAPGSFDVILCVDNQEFYAKGAHNRELLIKELDRLGVVYHVRRLQVGDFLWIAQQHVSDGGDPVELVLDYIVERKRMDDLAGSIVDGRFREQKYRLRKCGLTNAIYLVEDYGSMEHFKIPEDTLQQAIVNTQVVDELFVKKTAGTRQSAAYLVLMTRYLQSLYGKKTLFGYGRHFRIGDVADSFSESEAKLMTFAAFSDATVKTRPLSVSEMFAKQLMQLHGLTSEKAAAVIGKYPTPTALIEAFDQCSTDKERHALLADLKFGAAKRQFSFLALNEFFAAFSRELWVTFEQNDGDAVLFSRSAAVTY